MAKLSTVSYKLGIDAMRGKLATKQRDIRYSGQVEGANTLTLGYGKHPATNFDKYLVLTQRRGKNFFYCKSRTTLRNNLATTFSRSLMALAQNLADYVIPYLMESNDTDYREIRRAYEYYGEGKTLREFLVSAIIASVTARQQVITVRSVPVDPVGNTRSLHLINNPLAQVSMMSADIVAVDPQGQPELWLDSVSARKLVQEYLEYQATNMSAEKHVITFVDTRNGREYKRTWLYELNDKHVDSLSGTVQGVAFGATFDNPDSPSSLESVELLSRDGIVILSGTPYMDEAMTQDVDAQTEIKAITKLYI